MQAAVYLLGNSRCLHGGSVASDGPFTARAAAALLEAVLDAAPHSASQAFYDESGLLTIRMCTACTELGGVHELEVCYPLPSRGHQPAVLLLCDAMLLNIVLEKHQMKACPYPDANVVHHPHAGG